MTEPTETPSPTDEPAAASTDCSEPGCREAVEELYVFLDGQLDDTRRSTIQRHIDDCSHCLDTFDFHLELKMVVSKRCQTELPAGLRDRVLAALESFDDEI